MNVLGELSCLGLFANVPNAAKRTQLGQVTPSTVACHLPDAAVPPALQACLTGSQHVRRLNPFSCYIHRALISMSSMTTLSSSSASRFQFILDNALQDYTKQTGVVLTEYDFANQLELCDSPDEVLMLIRDKAKMLKEYRDGNRRLITWITPVVQFVYVFLGEVISVVSQPYCVQALRMTIFNPLGPKFESEKSHFCWYSCSTQCMCVSFSLLPGPVTCILGGH